MGFTLSSFLFSQLNLFQHTLRTQSIWCKMLRSPLLGQKIKTSLALIVSAYPKMNSSMKTPLLENKFKGLLAFHIGLISHVSCNKHDYAPTICYSKTDSINSLKSRDNPIIFENFPKRLESQTNE